jgi:septal ring factor EnvC (AmiA/AmiB activator)
MRNFLIYLTLAVCVVLTFVDQTLIRDATTRCDSIETKVIGAQARNSENTAVTIAYLSTHIVQQDQRYQQAVAAFLHLQNICRELAKENAALQLRINAMSDQLEPEHEIESKPVPDSQFDGA